MTPDDADRALTQLLACFEHQPISSAAREQWLRYLPTLDEGTFTEALERCRDQGGSKFSAVPGRRPGVAEFAAIAQAVSAERVRRARAAAQDEPWPEKRPELARERVAQLKAQLARRTDA